MKSAVKRAVGAAFGTTVVAWVVAVAVISGQAPAVQQDRPPMAEEVFKNIQVLKGIPVDQFMIWKHRRTTWKTSAGGWHNAGGGTETEMTWVAPSSRARFAGISTLIAPSTRSRPPAFTG